MKIAVSAENMKRSDRAAILSGIPGIELMKKAAEGIYKSTEWREPVGIVCGSGNNAGDGYALGEILYDNGISCVLLLCSDRFSFDGKYYFDRCIQKGVKAEKCAGETDLKRFKTIVDCIFGTGFHGSPDENTAAVINNINESGAYVVSADINSGLDSDNGLCDTCVVSDLTVSVGDYKYGHFLGRAKDKIKTKVNIDIGVAQTGEVCRIFDGSEAKKALPDRANFSNKSDFGYIALIGGSLRYCGAAKLSYMACAAMRSGSGVVKTAVPDCIAKAVASHILESTVFPLYSDGDTLVFDEKQFEELLRGIRSAAFGMGMGPSHETEKALVYLFENYKGALVIDADGLNALSRLGTDALKKAKCKIILTPHNKEFSRLLGCEVSSVIADPVGLAKEFAKEYGVTLLLKGPTTVVTNGEDTYFVDAGCPGMATAGSGDVLSGVIAALCGYNSDTLLSAAAGAYINGKAGEAAQEEKNPVSMIASDTVNCIPLAISDILKN